MNRTYADMPVSIFEIMSARARETGAINLGQGFPDRGGPQSVIDAAADALKERSNQYPPMTGLPELRAAIAGWYAPAGLSLSAEEVVVTSGATEALTAAILALVSPGDEVLLIQPLYDLYRPMVERAGGVPVPISLAMPDWRLDEDALRAAVTPKTRLVILCDPLNPSGSVARPEERAMLARLCVEHDLIALTDEVWEAVLFDGAAHVSLMCEPGMRERVVKVGSAGKIFAMTGWKVGWLVAAPPLARILARAHQFLTFTTPPNLQWGVAHGLVHERAWVEASNADFQRSRDRLAAGLAANGLITLPSPATWFINLDLAASGIAMSDTDFCMTMIDGAGVATIPISAFYMADPVTHLVRLCFAKGDAVLDEAVARLGDWVTRL